MLSPVVPEKQLSILLFTWKQGPPWAKPIWKAEYRRHHFTAELLRLQDNQPNIERSAGIIICLTLTRKSRQAKVWRKKWNKITWSVLWGAWEGRASDIFSTDWLLCLCSLEGFLNMFFFKLFLLFSPLIPNYCPASKNTDCTISVWNARAGNNLDSVLEVWFRSTPTPSNRKAVHAHCCHHTVFCWWQTEGIRNILGFYDDH